MVQKSILKDKPERLIKLYKKTLHQHGIAVEKIILFGSFAKGKAKPWSDLDVCVVSRGFGKDNYNEMVRLKKLAVSIEPMIEPYPYHPDDLRNPSDPLAFEITKTGRVV